MRIGIFSGTFNPIHEGHVLFALSSISDAGLDKVVFMAEPSPRHKKDVIDFAIRDLMVQAAIVDYPSLETIPQESGKPHTINSTIDLVKSYYGQDTELTLLVGSDVFLDIEEWGTSDTQEGTLEDLPEGTAFVVAIRDNADIELAETVGNKLALKNLQLVESMMKGVSSSKIRQALVEGRRPSGLNDLVYDYIQDNNIYKTCE